MALAHHAPEAAAELAPVDISRREAILDAASTVFLRFGFRKTSMEDVARAAEVSRQGLYLHFANKEELFRAAVCRKLSGNVATARAALANRSAPLESRLVDALYAWYGIRVGRLHDEAGDLPEASESVAGAIIEQQRQQFEQLLLKAIAGSRSLMAFYTPRGITALHLVQTLTASAEGLRFHPTTHEKYIADITIAVRILCAPANTR
jgi:AcrR family transcriptional regulator